MNKISAYLYEFTCELFGLELSKTVLTNKLALKTHNSLRTTTENARRLVLTENNAVCLNIYLYCVLLCNIEGPPHLYR